MASVSYENLALGWKPQNKGDFEFNIIAAIAVVVLLTVALVISSIEVPEPERQTRAKVPERIAQFVLQKEKEKPKPKPVEKKPKPKPVAKPKVKKKPKPKQDKPLTKQQKTARKKAESSGLLALGNELADLMDTSSVDQQIGGRVSRQSANAAQAKRINTSALTANAGQGSGGVGDQKYTATIGQTRLSAREVTQVRQSLLTSGGDEKARKRDSKRRSGSNLRAEEDITIVFDQNKSKLYSIYNRERRKNPGLKGKIVLEITIAPSGKVTAVRIVSSELNHPALERRIVSRIKQFNFGASKVETITVTYPIEFLPS